MDPDGPLPLRARVRWGNVARAAALAALAAIVVAWPHLRAPDPALPPAEAVPVVPAPQAAEPAPPTAPPAPPTAPPAAVPGLRPREKLSASASAPRARPPRAHHRSRAHPRPRRPPAPPTPPAPPAQRRRPPLPPAAPHTRPGAPAPEFSFEFG